MKYFLTIALFLFTFSVKADDVVLPSNTTVVDPELKNLEWNRYTTDNFVILSIDNSQGKLLFENMNKMRVSCLSRWGFPDFKFTKECRVFCVPNKALLKKLFGLEQSKIEIRKDLSVMWIALDDKPEKIIIPYLTQICFYEFENKHNVKLGFWFKKGSSVLGNSVPEIRSCLSGLNPRKEIFLSEKMFSMTEDDYLKETLDNRKLFDQEAVALCIMLRKEFGEAKLQGFLRITNKNNPQDVLKLIYGFNGYTHFDKQYTAFMRDLTADLLQNKTPDSYLEIKSAKGKS